MDKPRKGPIDRTEFRTLVRAIASSGVDDFFNQVVALVERVNQYERQMELTSPELDTEVAYYDLSPDP